MTGGLGALPLPFLTVDQPSKVEAVLEGVMGTFCSVHLGDGGVVLAAKWDSLKIVRGLFRSPRVAICSLIVWPSPDGVACLCSCCAGGPVWTVPAPEDSGLGAYDPCLFWGSCCWTCPPQAMWTPLALGLSRGVLQAGHQTGGSFKARSWQIVKI